MERTRKTISIVAILTVLAIIIVIYSGLTAGCDDTGGDSLIRKEGQLTILRNKILVGTDATYPPFEYVRDGNIEGFDKRFA